MDQTVQISIDATGLAEASGSLEARIRARFPTSSLLSNAFWLRALVGKAPEERSAYQRSFFIVRFLILLVIAGVMAVIGYGIFLLGLDYRLTSFVDLSQVVEAAVNDIIFLTLGIYFLFRFEPWIKRRRMLRFLGKLRDLVHVTQILQMHKDPERIIRPSERSTIASPKLGEAGLDAFHMNIYLDYCLDMLTIISATTAFVGREITDKHLRDAIWEVEELCGSISGKISNKTTMLFTAMLEEQRRKN